MLRDETILVGQRASKHAHIVSLEPRQYMLAASPEDGRLTPSEIIGPSMPIQCPKWWPSKPPRTIPALTLQLRHSSKHNPLRAISFLVFSSSHMTCPNRPGCHESSVSNSFLDPLASASAKCTVIPKPSFLASSNTGVNMSTSPPGRAVGSPQRSRPTTPSARCLRAIARVEEACSRVCLRSMARMRRVCNCGFLASKEEMVERRMVIYCSAEMCGVARGVVRSSR